MTRHEYKCHKGQVRTQMSHGPYDLDLNAPKGSIPSFCHCLSTERGLPASLLPPLFPLGLSSPLPGLWGAPGEPALPWPLPVQSPGGVLKKSANVNIG